MSDMVHTFQQKHNRTDKTPKKDEQGNGAFQRGVEWIETVLVPAVKWADGEMSGSGAALRLDLNLDRRSTNHPHCDFWFVQTGCPSGQSYNRAKYLINVTADCEVRLYRSGAPGCVLRSDRCGWTEPGQGAAMRGRQGIRDALSRRVIRRVIRRGRGFPAVQQRVLDLVAAF